MPIKGFEPIIKWTNSPAKKIDSVDSLKNFTLHTIPNRYEGSLIYKQLEMMHGKVVSFDHCVRIESFVIPIPLLLDVINSDLKGSCIADANFVCDNDHDLRLTNVTVFVPPHGNVDINTALAWEKSGELVIESVTDDTD